MEIEQKVLACVDQSSYADSVADYAAWAARKLGARLELLHVIDRHPETAASSDYSGAIGVDAQENLLNQLSELEAERSREAREQGRLFLDRLRRRCIEAGIESPDVRQRYGPLQDTLDLQQHEVALFVLGRRGESAEHTQRDLGRNVELISRRVRRPLVTVTRGFKVPTRALVAFDGRSMSRRGVELIAASTMFSDIRVDVLMSGKPRKDADKQLAWAQKTLSDAGFLVDVLYRPGDPERVIAETLSEREIDVLVMGAYSHSPLRSLFFGSRTSDLLRASRVPTVLMR